MGLNDLSYTYYTSPNPNDSENSQCVKLKQSHTLNSSPEIQSPPHTSPPVNHTHTHEIPPPKLVIYNDKKPEIVSDNVDTHTDTHTHTQDSPMCAKEHNKFDEITESESTHHPEGHTAIKLLVSHIVAGIIIGKNGQEINSIQSNYNIHIRLSASREYFPGTTDRVVLISGPRNSVIDTIEYLLVKIKDEAHELSVCSNKLARDKIQINLKMIIPHTAVGIIIGKGGSQVKELQEITGCKLYIDREFGDRLKIKERVCHIIGTEHQTKAAIIYILDLFEGDTRSELIENVSYPRLNDYQIHSQNMNKSHNQNLINLAINLTKRPDLLNYTNSIDMMIPGIYAGGIIGPNGKSVTEIQNNTHTNIQMSPKEFQEPNSGTRKLSISGPLSGVLEAYISIIDKMIQMQNMNIKKDNNSSAHSENCSDCCTIPTCATHTNYNNFYQQPNVARNINQGYINFIGPTEQSQFNVNIHHPFNYYVNPRNTHYPPYPSPYPGYLTPHEPMFVHSSPQVGYETDYNLGSHTVGYWNM